MGAIFSYSITVAIVLTLAYGGYRLSSNGSARLRRTVLLSIYAVALVIIPALLTVDFNRGSNSPIIMNVDSAVQPDVTISNGASTTFVLDILLWIYVSGAAVCLLLTLTELLRVLKLLSKCRKQKIDGQTVYVHNMREIAPLSIGNTMIINAADIDNPAIMIHERTHIALHHALDICVAQLTAIVCWYCPTVWIIRRELKLVHEFQADNAVIRTAGDTYSYCRLLVERTAGLSILAIANSLSHNNLKQRIQMMQTTGTERHGGKGRVMLTLVATVCAIILLSVPAVSNTIGEISQSSIPTHKRDTKESTPTFVIYGVDINQDAIKNGNFRLITSFENENITPKDVDGVILPRIGAIFCSDKKVLDRLTRGVRKYIVDGEIKSAKEYSNIRASEISKVVVSGNSMNISTRNLYESRYYDALETAINAENN